MKEGGKLSLMAAAPAIAIRNAGKVADAGDAYSLKKIDGTIKTFLDASDDHIAELGNMSRSVAKTAPIKIPEGAEIKPKVTNNGYYHIEYNWITEEGYKYITRWHTRKTTAPLKQRDMWIIERKVKGIGAGANHRQSLHQVRVGASEWITIDEWRDAARANQSNRYCRDTVALIPRADF